MPGHEHAPPCGRPPLDVPERPHPPRREHHHRDREVIAPDDLSHPLTRHTAQQDTDLSGAHKASSTPTRVALAYVHGRIVGP